MRTKTGILLFMLSVCAVAAWAGSPRGSDAESDPTVSVTSFRGENVIGHLGHPLGTVVRVTGVFVDGDVTRRRADLGVTLLQIETVNGEGLETAFLVPFRRAAHGVETPIPGQRFDYYVHEYGSFDGVVDLPEELEITRPPVQHDGFHYRPHVTVWTSNATASNLSEPQNSRRKR